jgi:hypothetical protein
MKLKKLILILLSFPILICTADTIQKEPPPPTEPIILIKGLKPLNDELNYANYTAALEGKLTLINRCLYVELVAHGGKVHNILTVWHWNDSWKKE